VTAQTFSPAARGRLTHHDLGRFPGDTLFARIGRVVCRAGCVPRKELYEAWEVARRTRRLFRGGRVVDLAAGHGLLAHVMLLLDDTSPGAVAVDPSVPPCGAALHAAVVDAWPRLRDRVTYVAAPLDAIEIHAADVVVSCHACGALTDRVLNRAADARARVAVLPCCHNLGGDAAGWRGWVDGPLAVDIARAVRLKARGYRVWTLTIPPAITPKNRLLLGEPGEEAS